MIVWIDLCGRARASLRHMPSGVCCTRRRYGGRSRFRACRMWQTRSGCHSRGLS